MQVTTSHFPARDLLGRLLANSQCGRWWPRTTRQSFVAERPISDIRRPELVATKQSLARASRDRLRVAGTGAASSCTNSSGDITRCVVPSRHGVLYLSPSCLAALH